MKKVFLLCAMAASTMFANAFDASHNYIEEWGNLTLKGVQLSSSKTGKAVQLKGWSSFGNYDENCVKSGTDIQRMKGMGANVVRLAKYFKTNGGYGEYTIDQIKALMAAAEANGMYCVVDWHILEAAGNNGNPKTYTSDAQQFFGQVAQEVVNKGYKHIIYELCNEPSGCGAGDIKSYAESVISTIAQYDKSKPIVIVGTPNWDQYINSQTIQGGHLVQTDKANVMYAFHLYANEGAHKQLLNSEFLPATTKVPVFVSEWGLSHAQPEKYQGDRWNDVNETVADQFMAMCNGQGGSGQIVSWCNWSYGNKAEGSSTFKSGCSGGDNLSRSGKYIVGVLGGELNPEIIKGAAFGGTPYTLSKESVEEQLNLDAYDQNPKAADEELGGSMDITYFDANNTPDENYEEGKEYNPLKLVDALDHDASGNKEGLVIQCYAGRAWCNTRKWECVDLTSQMVNGKWGGAIGLSWVSSGEWLNYTFDVKDPGYYSLEMCMPYGNVGYGEATMDEKTGKLSYTARASFAMSLVDHASQTFMVDIDASTETAEKAIEKDEFAPFAVKESQVAAAADHVWTPCATNNAGTKKANHGILFKEAGTHVVKLMFANGFQGELASLRFSYAKPWSGEGYPVEVETSVADASAEGAAIVVYPSVVEDGEFTVVAEGKAQVVVSNLAGATVYSTSIEGTTTVNPGLSAGIYNVQVVSADNAAVARIIVK